MNKQEFKTYRSLYRYYLRASKNEGNRLTKNFERRFGVKAGVYAFHDSGDKYSNGFSWAMESYSRIINRNKGVLNFA